MDKATKKKLELPRLFNHVVPSLVGWIILQIVQLSRFVFWIVFQVATGVAVFVDLLRLAYFYSDKATKRGKRWPWKRLKKSLWWEKIMVWFRDKEKKVLDKGWLREKERGIISSMGSYAMGVGGTFYLFGEYATVIALICLGAGDPSARVVGILYGNQPWKKKKFGKKKKKTLEGFLGFISACLVFITISNILTIWWNIYPSGSTMGMIAAGQALAILTAAIIEYHVPWLDNFFIPLGAGLAMWIVV